MFTNFAVYLSEINNEYRGMILLGSKIDVEKNICDAIYLCNLFLYSIMYYVMLTICIVPFSGQVQANEKDYLLI